MYVPLFLGTTYLTRRDADMRFGRQYRAKNDITNAIAAGLFSGAILARNSGPKAMAGGAVAFAAFSAAIDLFIRREPSESVPFLFPSTI